MMNTLRLVTLTSDDSLLLPNVRLFCMRGMYRHNDTPDDLPMQIHAYTPVRVATPRERDCCYRRRRR